MAVDPATGDYLVVWKNIDPSGLTLSIKGVLLGPLAHRKAPLITFQTSNSLSGFGVFPVRVAFNSQSRKFLVVWQSNDTSGTGLKSLQSQMVTADGRKFGQPAQIAIGSFSALQLNDLVFNRSANEFVYLYSVFDATLTHIRYFAGRLDADGTILGNPVSVNQKTQVSDGARIALDINHNTYLVVWSTASQIQYQVFSSTLRKFGSNRSFNAPQVLSPVLINYDSKTDQFAVFWSDSKSSKATKINEDGTIKSPIFSIALPEIESISQDTLSGNYLASYLGGSAVARINGGLALMEKGIHASCQPQGRYGSTSIVIFNPMRKEFLVTWWYANPAPQSNDIFGQKIRRTGSLQTDCPS